MMIAGQTPDVIILETGIRLRIDGPVLTVKTSDTTEGADPDIVILTDDNRRNIVLQ